MKFDYVAPIRGISVSQKPWTGKCKVKPWEYRVTAMIPVIDTFESLCACVEILRLQTERPYIIVIDTGSEKDNLQQILDLHDEDLEVHCIRHNGAQHPSDPVCFAMEAAQGMCRTEYMFATHSDAFIMRRDFLEWMLTLCGEEEKGLSPVVGYEMSPRNYEDWKGMISHTATMYHMPTMDRIGFGWSMRRLAAMCELPNHEPHPDRPNWPDTEILGNVILRQNEIKTTIIGKEFNFRRNIDENIDHSRSISLGMLYSPDYMKMSLSWFKQSIAEAKARIEKWKKEDCERISEQ